MAEAHEQTRSFNRSEWRKGLQELDPAARAAMAALSAEKDRPTIWDIDRMVAGLGARAEIDEEST